MAKDNIIPILNRLGFNVIKMENSDFGYYFEFEGINLVYHPTKPEDKSVMLMVPGAASITDENRDAVINAMLRMSTVMKYAKPVVIEGDTVWITYEHYLGDEKPSEDLLEEMVHVLAASFIEFLGYIGDDDEDEDGFEDEDDDDDFDEDDFDDEDEDDEELF